MAGDDTGGPVTPRRGFLANQIRLLRQANQQLQREAAAREAAEVELRESEEKFRAAFQTSPDAVNLNRLDGVYVDINEGFTQLTGYTRADVIGVSSRELEIWAIPEDRERLIEGLNAAGMVENLESVFRCKDGRLRTALMSARVIRIGGEPHILSVTRDITEIRRIDGALKASEARHRMLVEEAVDGILLGAPDGTINGANSRMLKLAGRNREDLLGRHIRELFSEGSLRSTPLRFDLLNQGRRVTSERELLLPDGSHLPIEMHTKKMHDGTYQSIIRDVSKRKEAERALRASEARFRQVVENAEAVIFVLDANGLFQLFEGLALPRLGLNPGELVGRSVFEVYRDRAEVLDPIRRALAGEALDATIHLGRRAFDTRLSPLHDDSRNPVGVLGVATDITDRIRSEEARLNLERQVLHAQKLESLGVMAGGIAHDFNNLLMGILGNAEVALQQLPPGAAAGEHLDLVVKTALRAAELTRQMLAYAGKAQTTTAPVDLNQIIEDNIQMLGSAAARNVTLLLDLEDGLPPVHGDLAQLQQLAMNLLTNASESLGDGPGTVSLRTTVREFDAEALRRSRVGEEPEPGRFVCLEVEDTGCGMDQKTLGRLFDPFFSTKFTGRGLGMAAALGIVKGHGGAIFTDSAPGRGSAIRILLPAMDHVGEQPQVERSGDPPTPCRLSGTVLLVDDDDSVLRACSAMLGELGLRALPAGSGEQAIHLFEAQGDEIDAVLMDLTMPGMDGVACFEALRGLRPDVSVVLASGLGSDQIDERVGDRCPAGVIQKPYRLAELAGVLKGVLLSHPGPGRGE